MPKKEKPDILLLYPKTGMDFGSTIAPPHSVLAVAAPAMRAGYSVKVLDQRTCRISPQDLAEFIHDDMLCIGISAMTGTQIRNALFLASMARKLTGGKIPIVWGGPHPSVLPAQTLESELVDIVVVGEGEHTFVEMLDALSAGRTLDGIKGLAWHDGSRPVVNEPRELMDVEELLPVPWELIDVEKYIHRDMYVNTRRRVLDLGQTSRGCPFRCGFCSSASIRGRKWRAMSPGKSLDMITEGVRRFDLDGFWLRDDEFYINRNRAHEICEGIISEGLDVNFYTSGTRVDVFMKASDEQLSVLKRSGAHTLKFGAESGSQRILDLMLKDIRVEQTLEVNHRCREHGIIPAFALVIGYPTETFDDIEMTIDMATRLRRENSDAQFESMATYTAVPGTPSYDLAVEHGLNPPDSLEGWANWVFDDFDFDGRKIPWYNARDRIRVGNISYMSILANALPNVVATISPSNAAVQSAAIGCAKIISKFYRKRLERKMYKFAPALQAIRYLRKTIFYESDRTIS